MARPFAYNPSGATISGCIQVGDIAVGVASQDYFPKPGGVLWWNGPDENPGYVIAKSISSGNQPNSINRITSNGQTASIGFNRSEAKTEESFLDLVKVLFGTTHSTGEDAKAWLEANGYWTSYTTWEVLMMFDGKKTGNVDSVMGSPGTSTFMTMNETSTGASSRTNIGDGVGLYSAFFNKTNITKIAFIDGSGGLDPTSNTNYLIYDLVESTGEESINDILKRLDIYQRDSPPFQNNDSIFGTPSVVNFTAGTNGYSGLLSSSGGTGFKTTTNGMPGGTPQIPDKFAVMGINRDSDNDIQALSAFWGNLNTGKGDSWRGDDPQQTFWSYWGNDFHSNSQTQRIGASYQTSPGVATGAAWTGNVYLVAF